MCAVPPRQSENSGGARRDVDGKQQVPYVARPLLPAGETRQCSRSRLCLPLERVAWLSGHYVAASGFGQKGSYFVRDCTGDYRKQPGLGEISLASKPCAYFHVESVFYKLVFCYLNLWLV